MSERKNLSTGGAWEPIIGYSRAVQVQNRIYVSGTTATNAQGDIVGEGDPRIQTVQSLKNIENALQKLGASLANVVRTRMFVTDIARWEEYARAHGELFKDIRPATTIVEVSKLISPKMMVEIEADAEL